MLTSGVQELDNSFVSFDTIKSQSRVVLAEAYLESVDSR